MNEYFLSRQFFLVQKNNKFFNRYFFKNFVVPVLRNKKESLKFAQKELLIFNIMSVNSNFFHHKWLHTTLYVHALCRFNDVYHDDKV